MHRHRHCAVRGRTSGCIRMRSILRMGWGWTGVRKRRSTIMWHLSRRLIYIKSKRSYQLLTITRNGFLGICRQMSFLTLVRLGYVIELCLTLIQGERGGEGGSQVVHWPPAFFELPRKTRALSLTKFIFIWHLLSP